MIFIRHPMHSLVCLLPLCVSIYYNKSWRMSKTFCPTTLLIKYGWTKRQQPNGWTPLGCQGQTWTTFHLIFKPLQYFNFNTTIEELQELKATHLWTLNNTCNSNRFTTFNPCHLFNRNNVHMFSCKPNNKHLQVIKPLKLGYQI